jgi:hypothetical protein
LAGGIESFFAQNPAELRPPLPTHLLHNNIDNNTQNQPHTSLFLVLAIMYIYWKFEKVAGLYVVRLSAVKKRDN